MPSCRIKRFAMLLALFCHTAWCAPTQSVAFYYGADPPLRMFAGIDLVVVEPAFVKLSAIRGQGIRNPERQLFAYVSVGEIHPTRPYFQRMPPAMLAGQNHAWGSVLVDQSAAGWTVFFLDEIITPLWQQGWRGFFLDTLDSYQLLARTDAERQIQVRHLTLTIKAIRQRYPGARLLLNRGFELLPELAPITTAVVAESLYGGFDARSQTYQPVLAQDRAWLLEQLQLVRTRYQLPAIVIDYVDPAMPDACAQVRQSVAAIQAHGFIPWVSDAALASTMQLDCLR